MAQSKRFNITFCTDADGVATLVAATKGPNIELISVQEVPQAQATSKVHKRNFSYANGKARKGIDGATLALQLVTDKKSISLAKIGEAMAQAGFAASGASSYISRLVAEGKVVRLGKGLVGWKAAQ